MRVILKLCSMLAGAAILAGCQTHNAPEPAVLESVDDATMSALHAALADAMGRARVELGPGDLTTDSIITVLPPPLAPQEDRSLAKPTYFDLMKANGGCILANRETGAEYPLKGVSCRRL